MNLNIKSLKKNVDYILNNCENLYVFYSFLECFGYEIKDEIISGIFDQEYDGAVYGPIFLACIYKNNKINLLSDYSNLIDVKKINKEDFNEKEFSFLKRELGGRDFYPSIIEEEFKILVCNIKKINLDEEFNSSDISVYDDSESCNFSLDFDKRFENVNEQFEYNKEIQIIDEIEDSEISIRSLFISLGYKEICTHPLLSKDFFNDSKYALSEGFLSRDYMRKSISDSFFSEYDFYTKHNDKMFEISDVFAYNEESNFISDKKSFFFTFSKRSKSKLYGDIEKFFRLLNITPSVYIEEGKLIIINNHKITHVGDYGLKKGYSFFDICLKTISSLLKEKDYKSYISNINIISDKSEDEIRKILFLNKELKIYELEKIDIYKNKYTFKVIHSEESLRTMSEISGLEI